jgi:uncharacterized membrane protein YfcA
MSFIIFILLYVARSCERNSECPSHQVCFKAECQHKNLFPMDWDEILGSFLILVASGLANAGGIGGGPLMVIILITIFNFDAYESVPLSQLIIFGGSLTAIIIKVFLRHPVKQRPLIDFDIALLLSSPLLIGATLGVIINLVIPQWLVLMIMTLLLSYISIDSLRTSIKIYKKENTTKTSVTLLCPDTGVLTSYDEINLHPELKAIYSTEKKIVPPKSLLIITFIFLLVVFSAFVRGSRNFDSIFGIHFCSAMYWAVSGCFLVVMIMIAVYCCYNMKDKYVTKDKLGYDFDTNDIKWNSLTASFISMAGLCAGLAAGVIGVGGGLVMNPVMLRFGMRPEVSTATSSFMVLFTSTISMLQYAIAGKLTYIYGLWTLAFSLVGSCVGILLIKKIVDKYKRSSIIVMLLALIMAACAVIIPTYGILKYSQESANDGFKSYCNP